MVKHVTDNAIEVGCVLQKLLLGDKEVQDDDLVGEYGVEAEVSLTVCEQDSICFVAQDGATTPRRGYVVGTIRGAVCSESMDPGDSRRGISLKPMQNDRDILVGLVKPPLADASNLSACGRVFCLLFLRNALHTMPWQFGIPRT